MLSTNAQKILNLGGGAIAVVLVMILAYLCWALVNLAIPPSNENILFALIGIVATQITQIVGFYFGSSASSKKQTDTIDKLAATAQVAQDALTPGKPAIPVSPGETVTVKGEE